MAAEPEQAPQPHLRPVPTPEPEKPVFLVVDPGTGESRPLPEILQPYEDEIASLQRAVRAEGIRFENLKRDKEREARRHELFPAAIEVFKLWKTICDHPRSGFGSERFEVIRPFLEKHGRELCERAVRGAAFEPFTKRRKNGTMKRYDDWGLIFRNDDKFEEFANKAPIEGGESQ